MVKDHLGNEFETTRKMCAFHKVSYNAFYSRRYKGYDLKECLEGGRRLKKSSVDARSRTDHTGQVFDSVSEMCLYWNVCPKTYQARLRKGRTVEQALTGSFEAEAIKESHRVQDHLGNTYANMDDLTQAYGVSYAVFSYRRRQGQSLEECLTNRRIKVTDHLGNVFDTAKEMCNYHHVPYDRYQHRIHSGLSICDALTKPSRYTDGPITDHKGNIFDTVKEMCGYYNIHTSTYRRRIKSGLSKQEALENPVEERLLCSEQDRTDHKGNVFSTKTKMLKFYEIDPSMFNRLKARGMSKDEILLRYEDKKNRKVLSSFDWKVAKLLYTSKEGTMYYLCTQGDDEEVLTVDEISASA